VSLSKNQLDKLGERLKVGPRSSEDLEMLDDYRQSFRPDYEFVTASLRDVLGLQPSGRAAKTTDSIVAKLRRGPFRLSRIQDIAGCRAVVNDLVAQDAILRKSVKLFSETRVVDRRLQPSHGYRAVHLIVGVSDRVVEVQLRTVLQHEWAQFSEKLADVVDPELKYGGGSEEARRILSMMSALVAGHEAGEAEIPLTDEARQIFDRSRSTLLELFNTFMIGVERGRIR
jgi:hypothetical protein